MSFRYLLHLLTCLLGQRLAAQKGQGEDLVGAMRAGANADDDPPSDEEEN